MKAYLRVLGAVAAASATASALAVGCTDATGTTTGVQYTAVYVEPESFRGNLTCGPLEGAMRSYVLTLSDVTNDKTGTDLASRVTMPSTPPTECALTAAFGAVVPGHLYIGEIDIYDVPACGRGVESGCIKPLGTGSRVMIDPGKLPPGPAGATFEERVKGDVSAAVVEPRWASACGDATKRKEDAGVPVLDQPNSPVMAQYLTQVELQGCQPPEIDTSVGGLVVRTSDVLGALTCAQKGEVDPKGKVDQISVAREDDSTSPSELVGCGQEVRFEGLAARKKVTFRVLGFEKGSTVPSWGARCEGKPAPGVITPAACSALTTKGDVVVEAAPVCSGGEATFTAELVGEGQIAPAQACGGQARFDGLELGLHTVRLRGLGEAGELLSSTLCKAQIVPGQTVTASCDPAQ